MEIVVENKSSAPKEYLKVFHSEINNLDEKIKKIIVELGFKIVLADKFCDLIDSKNIDKELRYYKENYLEKVQKDTIRGLLSDDYRTIFVFYKTAAKETLGAILYHEIGHLIDYYKYNFKKPYFSSNPKFINAYKKDLSANWDKIKNDNCFRLIHYIQNSTPKKAMENYKLHNPNSPILFGEIKKEDIIQTGSQKSFIDKTKTVQDLKLF